MSHSCVEKKFKCDSNCDCIDPYNPDDVEHVIEFCNHATSGTFSFRIDETEIIFCPCVMRELCKLFKKHGILNN